MAVLLAGLHGCLVAPPIERQGEVNHPFTVVAGSIQPPPQADHSLSLQLGDTLSFRAIDAVSDPDGDAILTFWFVRNPVNDEILDDHPFPTYRFDPCDRRFGSDLPPVVFLEVLASDRSTLNEVPQPEGDTVDEASAEPLYQTVGTYYFPLEANVVTLGWWWITIAEGGSCE